MKDPYQVIHDTTYRLLTKAATVLPKDVEHALKAAHDRETNETAKTQLAAILTNIEIAKKGIPMCQDTGIMIFYVKVGDKFPFIGEIKKALTEATKKSTNAQRCSKFRGKWLIFEDIFTKMHRLSRILNIFTSRLH